MDGRDAGLQSSRPELMAWWKQLEALQDAPVAHHDGNDVALVNVGGDDASGFVQVARTRDPSGRSMRDVVVGTLESLIARHRPDVLGGMLARAEDGAVTQVIYFGSEDEAREHEARPIPDEDAEASRRLWGDPAGRLDHFGLRSPILVSA